MGADFSAHHLILSDNGPSPSVLTRHDVLIWPAQVTQLGDGTFLELNGTGAISVIPSGT